MSSAESVTTVVTSYSDVESKDTLGAKAFAKAVQAIYGGVFPDYASRFSTDLRTDREFVILQSDDGRDPDNIVRQYWSPALLRSVKIKEITSRKGGGKLEGLRDKRLGLRATDVDGWTCAATEIDHLTREQQEEVFSDLSERTGLDWSLQVWSGSKSIHSYLSFTSILPANSKLRSEIQTLLSVLVSGDTKVNDSIRQLRCPGFVSPSGRAQPVLHCSPTYYDPTLVRDRLRSDYELRGGVDLELSYTALQRAESLSVLVKKKGFLPEAEDLASLLRATRFSPDVENLNQADALLVLHSPPRVSGTKFSAKGKALYEVPASVLVPFYQCAHRASCEAPCCKGTGRSSGRVYFDSYGGVRVHCFRHNHMVVAERPVKVAPPLPDHMVEEDFLPAPLPPVRKLPSSTPSETLVSQVMADWRRADRAKKEKMRVAREKLRDHDSVFLDRVRKKEEAAARISASQLQVAESSSAIATMFKSSYQDSFASEGWEEPEMSCRIRLGLKNIMTGVEAVGTKKCGRLQCPWCQAEALSLKTAAALYGAVLDDQNKVVGGGLAAGENPVMYVLKPGTTHKGIQGRIARANGTRGIPLVDPEGGNAYTEYPSFLYVGLTNGEGVSTLVTNLPPTGKHPAAETVLGRTAIQERFLRLCLDTFHLRDVSPFPGVKKMELFGKMTSSQNIHLDPEEIKQIASGNAWVVTVENPKSIEECRAVYAKYGVAVNETKDRPLEGRLLSFSTKEGEMERVAVEMGVEPGELVERMRDELSYGPRRSRTYHEDDVSWAYMDTCSPLDEWELEELK
jgi:hypothetical protein